MTPSQLFSRLDYKADFSSRSGRPSLLQRISRLPSSFRRQTSDLSTRPFTAPLPEQDRHHKASDSTFQVEKRNRLVPSPHSHADACPYSPNHYEYFPESEEAGCSSCTLCPWHDRTVIIPCETCRRRTAVSHLAAQPSSQHLPRRFRPQWSESGPRPSNAHRSGRHLSKLPPILRQSNETEPPRSSTRRRTHRFLKSPTPTSSTTHISPRHQDRRILPDHFDTLRCPSTPSSARSPFPLPLRPKTPNTTQSLSTPPQLHHLHILPNAFAHPYVHTDEVISHISAIRAGQPSPVTAFQQGQAAQDIRSGSQVSTIRPLNAHVDANTNACAEAMPPTPEEINGVRTELRSGSPEEKPFRWGARGMVRGGGFGGDGKGDGDVTGTWSRLRRRLRALVVSRKTKMACTTDTFVCVKSKDVKFMEDLPKDLPARRANKCVVEQRLHRNRKSVGLPKHVRSCNTAMDTQPLNRPMTVNLHGGAGNPPSKWPDSQRLPPTLWYFAGGSSKRPPGTARAWKQQQSERRMGGLLGMVVHGRKAGWARHEDSGDDGKDERAREREWEGRLRGGGFNQRHATEAQGRNGAGMSRIWLASQPTAWSAAMPAPVWFPVPNGPNKTANEGIAAPPKSPVVMVPRSPAVETASSTQPSSSSNSATSSGTGPFMSGALPVPETRTKRNGCEDANGADDARLCNEGGEEPGVVDANKEEAREKKDDGHELGS